MERSATLVVMRHGESVWTCRDHNRFAGWVDVDLTDKGRVQAHHAGILLKEAGLAPQVCMTSLLGRSIETAQIVLAEIGRPWLSVERTWRLNERHYGAFQGQTRPAMRQRYGDELFASYRRSYDVRPPLIEEGSRYCQDKDVRYGADFDDRLDGIDPAAIRGESLEDVGVRLGPWWEARIVPRLLAGQCVLVVTHGSVVRSVMMGLEGLSADQIRRVNVPCGVPLAFDFATDASGTLCVLGTGRYLDEGAARLGMSEVVALGQA